MSTVAERNHEAPRERKQVSRYTDTSREATVIVQGEGKKLEEIENVKKVMKALKKNSDTIILAHQVIYGTKGSQETRKKEVMQFSGLKGSTKEETEMIEEKRKAYLEGKKLNELVELCRVFCLAIASKEKEADDYVKEIMKFLKKPGEEKSVITDKKDVAKFKEEAEEVEEKPKKAPKKSVKKSPKKETKKPKSAKATPKKATKEESKTKKEAKKGKEEKKPKKSEPAAKTPKKKAAAKKGKK